MSSPEIHLILLSETAHPSRWPLGRVWHVPASLRAIHELLHQLLPQHSPDAWLFWDARLGAPSADAVVNSYQLPGDVWHAGLKLGMGGRPGLMDFISPTGVFQKDPADSIVATSWRLSLQASLLKDKVLRQLGGPFPQYRSLAGASLEMGYRYIRRGAFVRHVPFLVEEGKCQPDGAQALPFEDELRFALSHVRRLWVQWGLFRAVLSGYVAPRQALHAWIRVRKEPLPSTPPPYYQDVPPIKCKPDIAPVTVLIPTLERYPYLRTLLDQLRRQTIKPLEIIIVDQTPENARDKGLETDFADLPLRLFHLDRAGQCTARNYGLVRSAGKYILFLDDDVEVPPTLIEDHLRTLEYFHADASSGIADEIGAGPLPVEYKILRPSDVFPTNNTMIRKDALYRSGLFDLAYDHGQRADGDLGMRLYLGGALMVLNPDICVLHHHAPRGGLRAHKARVITYASSRKYLLHRHLASVSDCYLMMRYFTPRQVREAVLKDLIGTFGFRGNIVRRLLKAIISLILLPHSAWVIGRRMRIAREMFKQYPQIPSLDQPEAAA
jgi:glycosyltransferase involved in cell wall biosynthesis